MSGSGQKRLFLKNFSVPVEAAAIPRGTAGAPTVPEGKAAPGAAFPLSLVDLLNDRVFARLDHICPVVALDIAIVAQPRRFPIDRFGEGTDLHGLRQALPDPDPGSVLLPVVRYSTREHRACLR